MIEPLPNMTKVLPLVAQQEGQLQDQQSESKAMALAGNWKRGGYSQKALERTKPNNSGRAYNTGNTTGYGRRNYSFNNKGTWTRPPSSRKYCTHCKRNGHTLQTCYKIHGFPKKISASKADKANFVSVTNTEPEKDHKYHNNDTNFGLRQEQFKCLVNMLQQSGTIPTKERTNVLSASTIDPNMHSECSKSTPKPIE
ncbi:unnamed protein product [Lupinus luteus]|uniref:Uncharacterized protein n=1 Tax=Lupinus luteus TaxID=3873 RepID=A0AAV1Y743_LUPLU